VRQLSEVPAGTIVGKDGKPWYKIHREMDDDEAGIDRFNVGEDEIGLLVEFPDGGIEPRVVDDQEVEVFPPAVWDLPVTATGNDGSLTGT
jgi:hypothetical protein